MAKVYKNPGPIRFSATILRGSRANSWAYVPFPHDLKETFGVGNLIPVRITFDGRVEYRGSLAKMGSPQANILIRSDIRTELGKEPGETVDILVELDDKPREVIVPADVKATLKRAGQLKLFENLAYSHRKEYVQWIEDAKKPETRLSRLQKMTEMLATNPKSPKEQS
jgi:hypothetical protein